MIRQLFTTVLLLCTLAGAQAQETETTGDADGPKIFRVDVNIVQVDAVVTDKEGRPVIDLTAEDFIVLQDGKPQEITNFSLVRLQPLVIPRSAMQKSPQESRGALLPPPQTPVPLTPEEVRRVVALVVDDLGLSFSNMVRSREAIRKWIDEEMQPGDLVAVITTGLGMGGLQQFTGDRRILHEAIDRLHFNILSRVGGSGAFSEERMRMITLGTLEAMRFALKGMGKLPGRKGLMLFSENLIMNFDDYDEGDAGAVFSMNLSDSVKDKMDLMIQDANRSGVVIHVIDPRGITWAADPDIPVSLLTKSREGLTVMSQQTGGLFNPYHNFVEVALQEAANDGEIYYLIGYRPDAKTAEEMQENTNKYHEINVRVKRRGLQVRSRSGFFSTTEDPPYAPAPRADALAQAMLSPLQHEDLSVHLTSGYLYDPAGQYLLRAWVHLPGRQLTVLRDKNGENYISLETYAATTGFDGLIRDSDRMEHKIPLNTQDILSVREHGLRFAVTIPAKDPGAYFVRLAVKDQGSGKIGSAYQYVEIPDLKKEGLSLSDLFAVSRNEDIRLIISEKTGESAEQFYSTGQNRERSPAIRQYHPGESVEYLALIYNAETRNQLPPELETKTILYRDGNEIFRSEPEAVNISGISDLSRIPLKNRLRLGKTMPPGDYILQLQVRDRRGKPETDIASRSLDFQVTPELEPSSLEKAETFIRQGNAANIAGKNEEAAQAFAEAARLYRQELQLNPNDTVLWKQAGTVHHLAGETDQAVAACEEAVRLEPEDAGSHYMLAIIRATVDAESSIGDFREAIRLNPENAKYHFDLGRALAQINDFEGSIKAFREASRLEPEDGESHASMGRILEQMGEVDEAVAEYRRALTLNLSAESADSVRKLLQNALSEIEDPEREKIRVYYTLRAKEWRAAVNRHTPGEPDEAAREVGSWSVYELNPILYLAENIKDGKLNSYIDGNILGIFKDRRYINENIVPLLHFPDDPNKLLKKAALLHTDIAMFQLDTGYAPEETLRYYEPSYTNYMTGGYGITNSTVSAEYGSGSIEYPSAVAGTTTIYRYNRLQPRPSYQIDRSTISVQDGRENTRGDESVPDKGWHWRYSRSLLDQVTPRASEDAMVRKWYVATTARMLSSRIFNHAEENLASALELFPSDPLLLFYKGALHEKFASPSFQNAIPPDGMVYTFGSEKSELKQAREYFQKALKADPDFAEARLHLGRIRGLLGDHKEALEELRKAARSLTDAQLLYYCSLYLGNELASLNRLTEAREQYEIAAKLYPGAQSPLLGLSQLALKTGDYENALGYGRKIFNLPVKEDISEDPWWTYDVSTALNAPTLISEMYEASGGLSPANSKP
ncbi:MAG: tetratricopeptide repeat protein [Acidobacteria bacterium]|nr:tetratricopeptide repeat protein [Acidobacteriota bacterium]